MKEYHKLPACKEYHMLPACKEYHMLPACKEYHMLPACKEYHMLPACKEYHMLLVRGFILVNVKHPLGKFVRIIESVRTKQFADYISFAYLFQNIKKRSLR